MMRKFFRIYAFFRNFAGMNAATIGYFDGVHLGHRYLISQVCEAARTRGLQPLVITFDRHPRQVIDTGYVPSLLTTTEEKLALLREAGIEEVSVLRFDHAMSLLSTRDFMLRMRDDMAVRAVVMGYDHRFGHDCGKGTDYAGIAKELGMEIIFAHELPEMKASSSVVRRLLQRGDVDEAAKVLGYAYRLGGKVVHGHAVGRRLGFPTANVEVSMEKLVPACGAYAVWVVLRDGSRHEGMLNIGHRPTMDDSETMSVEVYLLDYEGDLYGETLSMEMMARLRDEQRFDNAEALAEQLGKDARRVRELLS